MQEIRREAIARVLARKRQPVTSNLPVGAGIGISAIVYERVEGSEFLPPENLGDWLDDMLSVAAQWRGPWTINLVQIAEAARVSEAAAVAEVKGARKLAEWDAFHLHAELERWRNAASIPAARSLMSALLAAWQGTRGLPDERPGTPELGELPDPRGPSVLSYPTPWGTVAGRLAWS